MAVFVAGLIRRLVAPTVAGVLNDVSTRSSDKGSVSVEDDEDNEDDKDDVSS